MRVVQRIFVTPTLKKERKSGSVSTTMAGVWVEKQVAPAG